MWNNSKPSLPGWYWVRNSMDDFPGRDLTPTIAKVFKQTTYDHEKGQSDPRKDIFIQFFGTDLYDRWEKVPGGRLEWLGPIELE